jgi:hypothetical protein
MRGTPTTSAGQRSSTSTSHEHRAHRPSFALEHDLFRKPPHTFRDHALALRDDALVCADAAVVLATIGHRAIASAAATWHVDGWRTGR